MTPYQSIDPLPVYLLSPLSTLYQSFPCSVEMNEAPLVKTAATLFRRSCYKGRESTIAGILCAGWDKREGGQVRRGRGAVTRVV